MPRAVESLVVLGVAVAAVAGSAALNEEKSPQEGKPGGKRTVVKLRKTERGPILVNKRGRTLYVFTRERGRPQCYEQCAAVWPPFMLRGSLMNKKRAKQTLLGSVRRNDGGRQVTYAGRPLYFHIRERKRGPAFGQGRYEFGGRWFAVQRGGKPLR